VTRTSRARSSTLRCTNKNLRAFVARRRVDLMPQMLASMDSNATANSSAGVS